MWQSLLDLDRELLLALNGDGGAFWDAFFYFVTARLTWIPLYAVLLYAVWRRFGTRGLLVGRAVSGCDGHSGRPDMQLLQA